MHANAIQQRGQLLPEQFILASCILQLIEGYDHTSAARKNAWVLKLAPVRYSLANDYNYVGSGTTSLCRHTPGATGNIVHAPFYQSSISITDYLLFWYSFFLDLKVQLLGILQKVALQPTLITAESINYIVTYVMCSEKSINLSIIFSLINQMTSKKKKICFYSKIFD